jgi:hypothetical protein
MRQRRTLPAGVITIPRFARKHGSSERFDGREWSYPGSVDTWLGRLFVLGLDGRRSAVAEGRVETAPIVEDFDIFEDGRA